MQGHDVPAGHVARVDPTVVVPVALPVHPQPVHVHALSAAATGTVVSLVPGIRTSGWQACVGWLVHLRQLLCARALHERGQQLRVCVARGRCWPGAAAAQSQWSYQRHTRHRLGGGYHTHLCSEEGHSSVSAVMACRSTRVAASKSGIGPTIVPATSVALA